MMGMVRLHENGPGLMPLCKGQGKRDFLEGPNAWKIGRRKLQNPAEWQNQPGTRGGKAPAWIRKDVLEAVFSKYHAKS